MSWKSENLSLVPLIWDRLRRDSGLETASQSSPPPRLRAAPRVCSLESLRIFLGFQNQSQIQTSPMELSDPDSEHLKISWKTPSQGRAMKGQALSCGTERCLLEALTAPQSWTPVSMLANWTQTPLTLFSRAPKLSPPGWPLSPVYSLKL